jgi:hypothetical protein
MDESKQGFGNGILKGLKRVLFTSVPEEKTNNTYPADPASQAPEKPQVLNQKLAENPELIASFPGRPDT